MKYVEHEDRSLWLRQISTPKAQKAWVGFSGQVDLPWLKVLKSGFRHCYIIINDGEHWVSMDPLSCHTEIMVHHIAPGFDLPAWLKTKDLTVVPVQIKPQSKQAPPMLYSCVEAVKRVIGMNDLWVITPWQLYKKLTQS